MDFAFLRLNKARLFDIIFKNYIYIIFRGGVLTDTALIVLLILSSAACLFSGNYDLLPFALHDRLHEHYRERMIVGFHEVSRAADHAGAYGTFLSGSGPSIAALVAPPKATRVAKAMQKAMAPEDPKAEVYILDVAKDGVILQPAEEYPE